MHDDESVDIALIQFPINPEKYELKFLPASMLVTSEVFKKEEIREGDDVFFLGLFISHFGQKRNYPIARFGKVAMLTNERIKWNEKDCDLYLLECQAFGGNSGAPVFFNLGPIREPGLIINRQQILLAGVMSGTFLNPSEVQMVNHSPTPFAFENAGIAAVVPAYLLNQILFSPELVRVREESVRNHKK